MDWNGHKQFFTAFTNSFPDLHHKIVDMVAEGDKVSVRFNVTGTHKGEFQFIQPTRRHDGIDAAEQLGAAIPTRTCTTSTLTLDDRSTSVWQMTVVHRVNSHLSTFYYEGNTALD